MMHFHCQISTIKSPTNASLMNRKSESITKIRWEMISILKGTALFSINQNMTDFQLKIIDWIGIRKPPQSHVDLSKLVELEFIWFLVRVSWWHHQMEIFSALLALWEGNSPVTGEFPSQRPVTRSLDVFFDLHLNKWLSKPSRHRWFATPSWSLWHHCNVQVSLVNTIATDVLAPSIIKPSPNMIVIIFIQFGAVLTQSRISWYHTQHCNNWSRT